MFYFAGLWSSVWCFKSLTAILQILGFPEECDGEALHCSALIAVAGPVSNT